MSGNLQADSPRPWPLCSRSCWSTNWAGSLFEPSTALLAGLVLATAPFFCGAAHFANPDALLSLCIVANLLFCWLAFSRNQGGWFLPAGLTAGLGMLAKGPVGVVLPLTIVLLFLAWSRRLALLWDRRLIWACLACALVFGPWYGWVGADTKGRFLTEFFINHNFNRFQAPMEGHGGGLYYYPMVLLLGLAPWSAFLGITVWYSLGRQARTDVDPPAAYRFLWCWLAVFVLFFSFASTKLPNYILPAYAPLALLTARWLDRWRRSAIHPGGWWMGLGLAGFGLVGVALAAGLLTAGGSLAWLYLPRRSFPDLSAWAGLGLLPVLGAGAAWWCIRRQQRTWALATLVGVVVVLLSGLATWGVMAVDGFKAPRPLAEVLVRAQQEREIRVASYQYMQPSLVFYCRRQVWILGSDEEVVTHLRYPIPAYLFLPVREWERLRDRVPSNCQTLGSHHDLYRNCEVVLVTNRPPS